MHKYYEYLLSVQRVKFILTGMVNDLCSVNMSQCHTSAQLMRQMPLLAPMLIYFPIGFIPFGSFTLSVTCSFLCCFLHSCFLSLFLRSIQTCLIVACCTSEGGSVWALLPTGTMRFQPPWWRRFHANCPGWVTHTRKHTQHGIDFTFGLLRLSVILWKTLGPPLEMKEMRFWGARSLLCASLY